jgi:hypothetical protein
MTLGGNRSAKADAGEFVHDLQAAVHTLTIDSRSTAPAQNVHVFVQLVHDVKGHGTGRP